LKQWIVVIKDFCDYCEGEDAPYWYNERPSLGTLAGAIWKAGGFVLEEYRGTKRYRKKKWEGRVDLYFSWKNKGYVIEAKQIWLYMKKVQMGSGLELSVFSHHTQNESRLAETSKGHEPFLLSL
jgi:hypothetical protein